MDRDLLRQSLGCHGPALLSLLRSEQQDNPHFRSLLGTAAEPARGAAPPQGAGRYWDRDLGRAVRRASAEQESVVYGPALAKSRLAPSEPLAKLSKPPRPHFQVATVGEWASNFF